MCVMTTARLKTHLTGVRLIESMPRSAAGEILRRELREQAKAEEADLGFGQLSAKL